MASATGQQLVNDQYPLVAPFAYAVIKNDPDSGQLIYTIQEIPLSKKESEVEKLIRDVIVESLALDFSQAVNRAAAETFLDEKVAEIARSYGVSLPVSNLDRIAYYLKKDFIGFGTVDPLLADPNIEDISCDGTGIPVFIVHKKYSSIATNIIFHSDESLNSFVIKVAQRANRHISVADPLLDAALPDGSRINCTYGREITKRGPTFTIRKFREDPFTIIDLCTFGTIDEMIAAFFWFVLEYQKSLLIAGGTAAGKTTLLNGVAMFIKPGNKVVSIEDTPELRLPHENWIQSVSRQGFGSFEGGKKRGEVTMYDLLRAAVRQRPDFLFVGEVRGAEAFTLFQAMATGHAGMGTIHGDSPMGVIRRLETKPMNIPRQMIASLNLISVQRQIKRKKQVSTTGHFIIENVRRCVQVVEVVGVDPTTNDLVTNEVFAWDPRDDLFQYSGRSYLLEQIQDVTSYSEEQIMAELDNRATIIKAMVHSKRRTFEDVASAITDYYGDPEKTLRDYKRFLKSDSVF